VTNEHFGPPKKRMLACRLGLQYLAAGCMLLACQASESAQRNGSPAEGASAQQDSTSQVADFKILRREVWGQNREATMDIDVFVTSKDPSIVALQKVIRDAGENGYHTHLANSERRVCNVMVRLHDKESANPNDEVAAYGTAHPTHTSTQCVGDVPEIWEWEYHVFSNR
jgi:hypothetical protein